MRIQDFKFSLLVALCLFKLSTIGLAHEASGLEWKSKTNLKVPGSFDSNIDSLDTKSPSLVLNRVFSNSLHRESESFTQSIEKLQTYHESFGSYTGYRTLAIDHLNNKIVRYYFILRYKKFPVFMKIDYYHYDNDSIGNNNIDDAIPISLNIEKDIDVFKNLFKTSN